MNYRRPFPLPCALRLLKLGFIAPLTAALAQDSGSTGLSAPTPPAIQLTVLQTWKAKAGDHWVYFNLVEPPVLPTPAPPPPPAPPTPQDLLEAQKTVVSVFIKATVYDNRIADLHVSGSSGAFEAFSNIPFVYLNGTRTIETADTIYSFFIVADNETSATLDPSSPLVAELTQVEATLPALAGVPAGTASQYAVADGTSTTYPDLVAALDQIHTWYDANSAAVIQTWQQQQAAAAQAALQASQNPPTPKNTVINFWPIQSNLFPTAPATGGGNQ